jgi:DNA-binding transcriptional LysR family regulator
MRPQLLKTFLAVARRGNITRAAADIHLAQSSVSDQIQLLEADLGAPLFMRRQPGLVLTPAGEALKPHAEAILNGIVAARSAVDAAIVAKPSTLVIGTLETVAAVRMPGWLAALKTAQPGLRVTIRVKGSGELMRQLDAGEIDMMVSFDRGHRDQRQVSRSLGNEPLVLAGRRGTAIQDLEVLVHQGFVVTETGCVYRHLFDEAFARAGLDSPEIVAEVGSLRAIIDMAAGGTGLALVPEMAAADAFSRGEIDIHPWPGPVKAVPLVATWRRGRGGAISSAVTSMTG